MDWEHWWIEEHAWSLSYTVNSKFMDGVSCTRILRFTAAYVMAWWFGEAAVQGCRSLAKSAYVRAAAFVLIPASVVGVYFAWRLDAPPDGTKITFSHVILGEALALLLVAFVALLAASDVLKYTLLSWMGKYSLGAYVLHITLSMSEKDGQLIFFKFHDSWVIPDIRVAIDHFQSWSAAHGIHVLPSFIFLIIFYPLVFMLTLAPPFHNFLLKLVDFLYRFPPVAWLAGIWWLCWVLWQYVEAGVWT